MSREPWVSIRIDSGRIFFAIDTEDVTEVTESGSERSVDASDGATDARELVKEGSISLEVGETGLGGSIGEGGVGSTCAVSCVGDNGWYASGSRWRGSDGESTILWVSCRERERCDAVSASSLSEMSDIDSEKSMIWSCSSCSSNSCSCSCSWAMVVIEDLLV